MEMRAWMVIGLSLVGGALLLASAAAQPAQRIPPVEIHLQSDPAALDSAPVRWPTMNLAAGQRMELPAELLQPAAAVRATAHAIENGEPLPGVQVSVIPNEQLYEAVKSTLEGNALTSGRTAITGADGSAVISGLSGGPINLRFMSEGRAPVFSEPLEAVPGILSTVEPVVIGFPSDLEVAVTRSDDWPPAGAILTAVLFPRVANQWITEAYHEADITNGPAQFVRVMPGRWRIDIHASVEQQQRYKVAEAIVELVQSAEHKVTVDLRRFVYQGYVTRRGAAVEAHLEFLPSEGTSAYAMSKGDGAFAVALAAPGTYRVAVRPTTGNFSTLVMDVPVVDPAFAIQVQLPDAQLRGTVRNEAGVPVGGVVVQAKRLVGAGTDPQGREHAAILSARTDAKGAFLIESVPDGRWQVAAATGHESSEPLGIAVPQELPVALTLKNKAELIGRVVTDAGTAVVAASGMAVQVGAAPEQMASVSRFWTTANGEFRVVLDRPSATAGNLMIFPHELPVGAFRVPAGSRAHIIIPKRSGGVRIAFPRRGPDAQRPPLQLLTLISPNGGFIPLHLLLANAGSVVELTDRTVVHVPRVAPGPWMLARFASIEEGLDLLSRPNASLPIIATFHVTPDATVEVAVP